MPAVKLNGPESCWQQVCKEACSREETIFEAPVSELIYTCFTPENLWGYDHSLPGTLDCVQMLTVALKQFCFHLGGSDTTTKVSATNNSGLPLYGVVRKIRTRTIICSAPTQVHSMPVHPPAPQSAEGLVNIILG